MLSPPRTTPYKEGSLKLPTGAGDEEPRTLYRGLNNVSRALGSQWSRAHTVGSELNREGKWEGQSGDVSFLHGVDVRKHETQA